MCYRNYTFFLATFSKNTHKLIQELLFLKNGKGKFNAKQFNVLINDFYTAVHPPSTAIFCPVMYLASSDSKKVTAGLMSCGKPILPRGVLAS